MSECRFCGRQSHLIVDVCQDDYCQKALECVNLERKHADEIQRLSHDIELLLAREKGLKAERDEWFTVARDIKQELADAEAAIERCHAKMEGLRIARDHAYEVIR